MCRRSFSQADGDFSTIAYSLTKSTTGYSKAPAETTTRASRFKIIFNNKKIAGPQKINHDIYKRSSGIGERNKLGFRFEPEKIFFSSLLLIVCNHKFE